MSGRRWQCRSATAPSRPTSRPAAAPARSGSRRRLRVLRLDPPTCPPWSSTSPACAPTGKPPWRSAPRTTCWRTWPPRSTRSRGPRGDSLRLAQLDPPASRGRGSQPDPAPGSRARTVVLTDITRATDRQERPRTLASWPPGKSATTSADAPLPPSGTWKPRDTGTASAVATRGSVTWLVYADGVREQLKPLSAARPIASHDPSTAARQARRAGTPGQPAPGIAAPRRDPTGPSRTGQAPRPAAPPAGAEMEGPDRAS